MVVLTVVVYTHCVGYMVTLLWMLWHGHSTEPNVTPRPWTSEDYLLRPLAWEGVVIRRLINWAYHEVNG